MNFLEEFSRAFSCCSDTLSIALIFGYSAAVTSYIVWMRLQFDSIVACSSFPISIYRLTNYSTPWNFFQYWFTDARYSCVTVTSTLLVHQNPSTVSLLCILLVFYWEGNYNIYVQSILGMLLKWNRQFTDLAYVQLFNSTLLNRIFDDVLLVFVNVLICVLAILILHSSFSFIKHDLCQVYLLWKTTMYIIDIHRLLGVLW